MYEAFFGLRERPFHLTPDPRFLFLNPGYREALATLRYGLSSSIGITLLVGEAGTGKTTLVRAALQAERGAENRVVLLNNPALERQDFFDMVANRLRLPQASGSKSHFLLAFEHDLLDRFRAGIRTAVVIDEAQSAPPELLEEIRLLANLETETEKLVNLVLVGQPELADRLNEPSLRALKQRIVLRCSLAPLDLQGTISYIASRLRIAGALAGQVFTAEAAQAIYDASGGNPRSIGVICENALLAAYARQRKPIDRAVVTEVCRDLDLPLGRPSATDDAADSAEDASEHGGFGRSLPLRQWTVARAWFSRKTDSGPKPVDGEARPRGFVATRK
jgi:type II secretory pathway predicted ATPase ExeA